MNTKYIFKNKYTVLIAIISILINSITYANNKNYATLIENAKIETNVEIVTSADDIIISTISTISSISNTTNSAIDNKEIFEHDGIKFRKKELVGNFKLTGYCACKKCTPGTGITYSGKKVRANHTVAADLKILPIGTYIYIEGTDGKNVTNYNGVYQVEDKGGGVKNKHIDIYQPTHELASLVTQSGKIYANVYILETLTNN